MRVPNNMLVYYGWLNSFNSAVNGWNNEKVSQELAKYNILVLGDGVQDPSHGDYANSKIIIARVQELHPEVEIFGYVTINQSLEDFKKKASLWNVLEIDGIFLDEAGYDFGKTRNEFNDRVDFVHDHMAKPVMANAWKPEHVLSNEAADEDTSYLNATYNPDMDGSSLDEDDYLMLESYGINQTGGYEAHQQWYDRGMKAWEWEIKIVGLSVIPDADSAGQAKFDFGYTSALMMELDAYGSSDTSYGASTAASKMWIRPDISALRSKSVENVVKDSTLPIYCNYKKNGLLKLDFTASSESSSIDLY